MKKLDFDVNASILKHISLLNPWFPKIAFVSIGDYSSQILLKGSPLVKSNDVLSLFVEKSSKDAARWEKSGFEAYNILGLDADIDTHFWFNILPYITDNETVIEKLRSKPIDKLDGAIVVASIDEGVGSVLLPHLVKRFREMNVNSLGIALLPSKAQLTDAFFNSLWSVATCAVECAPMVLISRDYLESYVGVDRKGSVVNGDMVLNYLLELVLSRESFVKELCELSRTFNVKMFTILAATGASLMLHGSLENILNTTLLRPFVEADLSSASVLYVLIRMPVQLRDQIPRGKIELAIDNWVKAKASLKSVYVSEPVYVDDGNDRLDIVMFMGGLDLSKIVTSTDKKVNEIKSYAIKNGFMSEKEWQKCFKGLAE